MCEQKTRCVNKYKEDYDVYIGRGSKWGNPFTSKPVGQTKAAHQCNSREEAVAAYEHYLRNNEALLYALRELIGMRLGCFCKPKACHGDVLVKLVQELYGDV